VEIVVQIIIFDFVRLQIGVILVYRLEICFDFITS